VPDSAVRALTVQLLLLLLLLVLLLDHVRAGVTGLLQLVAVGDAVFGR